MRERGRRQLRRPWEENEILSKGDVAVKLYRGKAERKRKE